MPIQPKDYTPPVTPPPTWQYGPPTPPPVQPPVTPEPVEPPAHKRIWPFVAGAAVVAALGLGLGLGLSGGAGIKAVDVQITDDVDGGCIFNADSIVTLKDEHGTTLSANRLGGGTPDDVGGCVYDAILVKVPDDAKQYTETADAIPGSVTFSNQFMLAHGWVFPVTIYKQ